MELSELVLVRMRMERLSIYRRAVVVIEVVEARLFESALREVSRRWHCRGRWKQPAVARRAPVIAKLGKSE